MSLIRKTLLSIIAVLLLINGWLFFSTYAYSADIASLEKAQVELAVAQQKGLDWSQCAVDAQMAKAPLYLCNGTIGYPQAISHEIATKEKLVEILSERLK